MFGILLFLGFSVTSLRGDLFGGHYDKDGEARKRTSHAQLADLDLLLGDRPPGYINVIARFPVEESKDAHVSVRIGASVAELKTCILAEKPSAWSTLTEVGDLGFVACCCSHDDGTPLASDIV